MACSRRSAALALALAFRAGTVAWAQTASFDGVYRPPSGGAVAPQCTTRITRWLVVKGGVATMQLNTIGTLEGSVRPDGSLLAQAGQVALSGRFSGSHFGGTLSYGRCQWDMQMDRSG